MTSSGVNKVCSCCGCTVHGKKDHVVGKTCSGDLIYNCVNDYEEEL